MGQKIYNWNDLNLDLIWVNEFKAKILAELRLNQFPKISGLRSSVINLLPSSNTAQDDRSIETSIY